MRLLALLLVLSAGCRAPVQKHPYFEIIGENDMPLKRPAKGEWRETHHETEQSLADYRNINPKKARTDSSKLYLVPLGVFTTLEEKLLEDTREYLEIFFQLRVEFLPFIPDSIIPSNFKRINGNTNAWQLHTVYIMDSLLKDKMPAGGYALMAISKKDLYPKPGWSYVFGIASYVERIGVSSIARYYNPPLENRNYQLCLRRIIATSAHEIGHMFSIKHCMVARCGMNGSNSLPESDGQPLRFCSACQEKLHSNIGYDNKKRLNELLQYERKHQLWRDVKDLERDSVSLN